MSNPHPSPRIVPGPVCTLSHVLDRLEAAGVGRGFARRRLLPEWWRDESDGDADALASLCRHVAALTGIPAREIEGTDPVTTIPRYTNLPCWCGARLSHGGPCTAEPIKNPRTRTARRCRRHGGMSTGARTEAGKARQAEAASEYLRRIHELARQGGEAA